MALAASQRTELLVDADIHSIEQIRQGMNLLKDEGQQVHMTLFAPPGRVENKQWREFMTQPDITFEPVQRSHNVRSEPNDEAIGRAMRRLSARDDVACIGLLTADNGFIDIMVELESSGIRTVALVPATRFEVLRSYGRAKIRVLRLNASYNTNSRVRAVLNRKGHGSVHLADPYEAYENTAKAESVMAFLQDLGFWNDGQYLIQAVAKFWFANGLGSLSVFPAQLATVSAYDVMQAKKNGHAHYDKGLAYFLPVSAVGSKSKDCFETYGSRLARQIFRGGGPFMLQDSPDLTRQVLRRLGYLDDDLNDDLPDALFCFLNASWNKFNLRQLGMLPGSGSHWRDVDQKLHAAFLSNESKGNWQVMRKEAAMSTLLPFLRKAKVLGKNERGPAQVFQAARVHADQHGLPPMRTFNGLALRILLNANSNPTKRKVIEVGR